MPRLHTIQSPAAKGQHQAKSSRPTKTSPPTPLSKREITAADMPKIAIGMALTVGLLGAGWFSSGKANVQQEQERMQRQMKLESGTLSADIDPNLSPEEADEAQNERESEREATDPNFQP